MTVSGGETALFWVLAPLMTLAALGLIFVRRAVHAAICVMFVMVGMAILYVAQEASFLGVVQVVVYTGAVMMLFLFVLMLVGIDAADSLTETIRGQRWLGVLLGLGLAAVLLGVISAATFPPAVGLAEANAVTNPVALARVLLADYVLAMEVVGVLLVTAALAGLVLTHRRRISPKVTQRDLARERVAALPQGRTLTPLPAPGVYAQNNAMDTPALGPDGAPLEHSVPRVLRIRGQARSATAVLAAEESLVARELADAGLLTADADADDDGARADGARDAHQGEER
ncbi:NADH-quinone oxidoreductase subunit J [Isoptericola sp. NEAU-Y5]|uniref:NADH-quinone oxidoreductase subunit J n=1 Tax=Isoptericola luteus TaxID=2879484 RepID=A0ABS7ZJF5_9MICO|nr:NADH-quinone oxidoreductase subunit J [Isoptericola sp. NEAU-Y5]MCA5895048.1 NADH-quinone oxidoreductase subunit J [Isoptericola sp. NEAU-Y5]